MKRRLGAAIAAATTLAVLGIAFAGGVGAKTSTMLAFDVMTPVVAPYTGPTNPIRGINGGGVPWVIHSARASLTAGGRLKVEVEGLVVASSGSNPIAAFKAIVSCQDIVAGAAHVTNVSTGTFTATMGPASGGGGNADIEAQLTLPHPCIAPIVFVTSGGGSWFASTGF